MFSPGALKVEGLYREGEEYGREVEFPSNWGGGPGPPPDFFFNLCI